MHAKRNKRRASASDQLPAFFPVRGRAKEFIDFSSPSFLPRCFLIFSLPLATVWARVGRRGTRSSDSHSLSFLLLQNLSSTPHHETTWLPFLFRRPAPHHGSAGRGTFPCSPLPQPAGRRRRRRRGPSTVTPNHHARAAFQETANN